MPFSRVLARRAHFGGGSQERRSGLVEYGGRSFFGYYRTVRLRHAGGGARATLASGGHDLGPVLVSGGSGPIGTALLASLQAQGTQVVRLVRGTAKNAGQVSWDPLAPVSPAAVSGFDAVIHLAGESVVGRWTNEKKNAIRDSRVLGTRHLTAALAQGEARPRVLVCASAIGFYGDRGDEVLRRREPDWAGISARGLWRVGRSYPGARSRLAYGW